MRVCKSETCDNEVTGLKHKRYCSTQCSSRSRRRRWYHNNKEKDNKQTREYYRNNSEALKQYQVEYRANNKERINDAFRKYRRNWKNHKYKNDAVYSLICKTRSAVNRAFRQNGFSKSSNTQKILGCSYKEFIVHLENQFVDGMEWKNRSLWHIDHIKPISLAKTEEEVIELSHYTNLQPLWARDNRKKSNKYYKK